MNPTSPKLLHLLLLLSSALLAQAIPFFKHGAQKIPIQPPATPAQQTFNPHPSIVRQDNPREYLGESLYSTGINVVGSGKLVTCHMRKVASRVMAQLDARVDGLQGWHSQSVNTLTQYLIDANERIKDVRFTEQTRPPSVVMVRNPVSRVLSAYITKLENKDFKFCWDAACPKRVDSFGELLRVLERVGLEKVNKHFTPQLDECGFNLGMTYDCIIDYDNRAAGWKECLTKLGLWEQYGASGWGPSGTEAIFEEEEPLKTEFHLRKNSVASDPSVLEKFYTPELLDKVFKIYRKDFELFGYSRDVSVYIKPKTEIT